MTSAQPPGEFWYRSNPMNPQRWEKVKDIFWASAALPAPRRSDYLLEACGADEDLRVTIERLLQHHNDSTQFLERPAIELAGEGDLEADPSNAFAPGDVVGGRFRINQFIARGGMGEVYEVSDEAVGGVRLALKTIRASLAWDARVQGHFRSEVQLARQITHPNVCRIHDLFQFNAGTPRAVTGITMELIEGETLVDRIRREGPLSPGAALPLIEQMIAALQAAHDAGVVHRDLKCSNVMLTRGRSGAARVVVTDFGLAAAAARGEGAGRTEQTIAGTLDYMAPEQLTGGAVTQAADLYALGIVMFEMLRGRHPFGSSSSVDEALDRARQPLAPSYFKGSSLPVSFLKTIVHCLQPDPKRRPESARAVWEELTQLRRYTRRAAVAGVLFASAAFGSLFIRREFPALFQFQAPAEASIAVLPLANETQDTRLDYVSDGIAEEVIDALTRIPSVRVPARNSSFQFRQQPPPLQEIARRLNVGAVLMGSVRQEGDRLRISVQLVNAKDGFQFWSNNYLQSNDDLPRLRAELAGSIAESLRVRLSQGQQARLVQRQTTNAAAYNHYLLGKQAAARRSDEALQASVDQYTQALQLDPDFALAYAALSDSWNILAGRPGYPSEEAFPKAEAAAKRALELNPQLGEAHNALGSICQRYHWDWDAAQRHFQMALELNPGLASAHHWYAGCLSNLGRHEEALKQIRRAHELDPLSLSINTAYGGYLYYARRYDEAIEQLRFALELSPRFVNALILLGEAYEQKGMYRESIENFQRVVEIEGRKPTGLSALACVLARSGQTAQARALLMELEAMWPTQQVGATQIADVYRELNDRSSYYRWLEIAYAHHDASLMGLKVDPSNDFLRRDPEFRAVLERLRLQ